MSRAVDRDREVAREGEHRDRLRLRVDPQQHERVRSRGRVSLSCAVVVPDEEPDGRLVRRRRQVEPLLRGLYVDGLFGIGLTRSIEGVYDSNRDCLLRRCAERQQDRYLEHDH